MLVPGLYLGAILLGGLVVFLARALYLSYKDTNAEVEKIEWAGAQLDKALIQIRSEDDDIVLLGLQTIDALNKLGLPLDALPALADLLENRSPVVKRYAQVTIKRLSTSGEFSRLKPPPDDDETDSQDEK